MKTATLDFAVYVGLFYLFAQFSIVNYRIVRKKYSSYLNFGSLWFLAINLLHIFVCRERERESTTNKGVCQSLSVKEIERREWQDDGKE